MAFLATVKVLIGTKERQRETEILKYLSNKQELRFRTDLLGNHRNPRMANGDCCGYNKRVGDTRSVAPQKRLLSEASSERGIWASGERLLSVGAFMETAGVRLCSQQLHISHIDMKEDTWRLYSSTYWPFMDT